MDFHPTESECRSADNVDEAAKVNIEFHQGVVVLSRIVSSRMFTEADQAKFASISGDFNPMHVDLVTARRTGLGALVVHGVHNLLWCLDTVTPEIPDTLSVSSLRVNFDTFVLTEEQADVVLAQCDAHRLRAEVRVGGTLALTALITFGDTRSAVPSAKPVDLFDPVGPIDMQNEQVSTLAGRLLFATPPTAVAGLFPNAAQLIGPRRLATLAAFSRLIGMVCPGQHSVFNKISLEASDDDGADDICFRSTSFNMDHRRLLSTVWGGGWVGTLTSMIRHPPTVQPSITELSKHVVPHEFRQSVALVVGGSRGIGEVVAKMIAAGGGLPIITYAVGKRDAERVAAEIREWGGLCEIMRLNIRASIVEQLTELQKTPNQVFYFATPMIVGRRTTLFDPVRLEEFLRFYVTGFYNSCCALIEKSSKRLIAFYPSSVFVEDRPPGITEYAMAKAAGEQLCHDMNASLASFRAIVCRLPRLPTDQNPGLMRVSASHPSVCDALLPALRDMASVYQRG